jgi:hypothetical protein
MLVSETIRDAAGRISAQLEARSGAGDPSA